MIPDLRSGQIIKIELKPYFKKTLFGLILDYNMIFDADCFNFIIHIFENNPLIDDNFDYNTLYSRPICINSRNVIYLEFEKRIQIIGEVDIYEDFFIRNMKFASGSEHDLIENKFEVFDLELGIFTEDVNYNLEKIRNLEFVELITWYTIVERLALEELKILNKDVSIFSKNSQEKLQDLAKFYKYYIPLKLAKGNPYNFVIEWSLVKRDEQILFKLHEKSYKSRCAIRLDINYFVADYLPIFKKQGLLPIGHNWHAIFLKALMEFKQVSMIEACKLFDFFWINNSGFVCFFNDNILCNEYCHWLNINFRNLEIFNSWLIKTLKDKEVWSYTRYDYYKDDEKNNPSKNSKIKELESSIPYVTLFKIQDDSKIEYSIHIDVEYMNNFKEDIGIEKIPFNGDDLGKFLKKEIKRILSLPKMNFKIDEEAGSCTIIFREKEDFNIIKKYFSKIFNSNKKTKDWITTNFN